MFYLVLFLSGIIYVLFCLTTRTKDSWLVAYYFAKVVFLCYYLFVTDVNDFSIYLTYLVRLLCRFIFKKPL